jgi:hypothetical protein
LGDSLLPTTVESEDCLTLNIFVPRHTHQNRTKLPVFAWSYGGAFGEGGGSVPLFNPTQFVAENKDIILVTWKYATLLLDLISTCFADDIDQLPPQYLRVPQFPSFERAKPWNS